MVELNSPFPSDKRNKHKAFAARLLLKSLIYSFAIFGILFILLLLVVLGILRKDMGDTAVMPKSAILTVDFDTNYAEVRNDDILAEVTGIKSPTFFDIIRAINIAAYDSKVKVLMAKVSVSSLGLAQVQELRSTIANFRKAGKKAYIFSDGFGSFGQGTSEYYLATAFDEIWMQPNTEVGITGLAIEVPFFKKLLNKVGVSPEFYSRYEYKTAMASMTDARMSAPFREELNRLGGSIFNRFLLDAGKARAVSEKHLKALVNKAPLSSEEALENRLIDKIAYKQDLLAKLKDEFKAEPFAVEDYAANIRTYKSGVPAIAFLVIDGVISEGESYGNPLRDETIAGADTILSQLKEIAEDKEVKGLVLRVNSPGGSYGAANEIWYAVKQLKETKKIPVIVSMGNYAASGGYFVALAGDYILAEPLTITGSIGVLGGKMVLSGLWNKLGIDWNSVQFGNNAGILSPNHRFNNSEKAIFNKSLDRVYKDFTLKVSEARKLNIKELDKLARGRVWTGENAVKNKLVDGLGGIETAMAKVMEIARIKSDAKFRISYYPKEKTLQEKIRQMMGMGTSISTQELVSEFGLDIHELNMLKRLQYDTILMPLNIEM